MMLKTTVAAVAFIIVVYLSAGQQSIAEELRPEHIARIQNVDDPDLSADGRYVAYTVDRSIREGASGRDVWIARTSGKTSPERLIENAGDMHSPSWSPNGQHLAFLSAQNESAAGNELFVIRSDGERMRRLSPVHLPVRSFKWSKDGHRIAFLSKGLWVANVEDGLLTRAAGTESNVLDLAWSPDGEKIAVNDGGRLVIINAENGQKVQELTDGVSKPWSRRKAFDWSPDGRWIVFAKLADSQVSPAGIGFWLSVIPASGGDEVSVLKDYPGTITQALWSPDSKHLLAQSFEHTRSKIIRVNTESGDIDVIIDNILEEKSFTVDASGNRIAWLSSSQNLPVDVWFRDLRSDVSRRLTAVNDYIAAFPKGAVQTVRWKGASGRDLTGVLVLPVGYCEGVNWPTIVQLHGGPHFAWWEGWLGSWHDWAQLLASNGYAVFLPNPRGSTGQGLEFSLANVNDIGDGPLDDVLRGVDHIVDIGIADPDKLGLGGWSYGGYLTAWGITQTDRFQAAIVGAGISRVTKRSHMLLKEYYGNVDIRQRYDSLARISPDNFLEKVVTPTLIIHGKDDPKISHKQAVELHDGLDELGVETELILYEGEGHGIGQVSNREDMLERIVAWFDGHIIDSARGAVRDERLICSENEG